MISYLVECERCDKKSEYNIDEINILELEFLNIVSIGNQKLHLCKKCYLEITNDPTMDEQICEDIMCEICKLLKK